MTRGPPAGHSFSRPVSFEMRVRSGPCHCGQSAKIKCEKKKIFKKGAVSVKIIGVRLPDPALVISGTEAPLKK